MPVGVARGVPESPVPLGRKLLIAAVAVTVAWFALVLLWDEAPFERPVVRELVTMMADGAHTTVEIASDRFTEGGPQSYTVVRARLDVRP